MKYFETWIGYVAGGVTMALMMSGWIAIGGSASEALVLWSGSTAIGVAATERIAKHDDRDKGNAGG